ncbi:ABC transporter substrate-binding protein [Agromyces atrinae]|uniref:NitT/TauT family transport system substrate-binding protein n=1 Tax=Agromyces atrinae TaxID=592376 RepID=A0A4Q2M3G1_9MICO|nr:ABC transporter substrate-binding protein [Agromyces atrinae]NYD65546.1 NitT/TauT family transport system substrate-binding protein [Agromyces atrinae]RXZ85727.1 thiamine biosynthesis protein [Agromyces atrinae]
MAPRTPTARLRTALALVGVAALTATLAACSTDEADSAAPGSTAGSAISAERCAENEAAGTVTYLTGYQYQASASILEVIAAKELGYFDALCIDLDIQPGTGDTGQNTQLLASEQVQFTAVSQQNIIQAQDSGIDILGISSYSNVGLEVLITGPEITDLTQLEGTILGQKGELPPTVGAMLDNAGVDVGSIQQVVVGYDPSVLTRGQVTSLTGFISNEPNLLEAMGEDVTVWRPYDEDVPSSLGALAVNPGFASEHPTVVEDFLRASFHAFEYCEENGEECVGYASALSGEGYDAEHNLKIWETEAGIVRESQTGDLGAIDTANVEAIAAMLDEYSLLETPVSADDALAYFEPAFVTAVYADGTLVWPAP